MTEDECLAKLRDLAKREGLAHENLLLCKFESGELEGTTLELIIQTLLEKVELEIRNA